MPKKYLKINDLFSQDDISTNQYSAFFSPPPQGKLIHFSAIIILYYMLNSISLVKNVKLNYNNYVFIVDICT